MSTTASDFITVEWRDLWSFKVDYIFVGLAYIFSIYNFDRMERDIEGYGGAAFAAAYVASLLFCCLPLILMELAVGQITARAPVQALGNICPLFKGVGISHVILSLAMGSLLAVTAGYYTVYLVYLFYGVATGAEELPWLQCGHTWNHDCKRTILFDSKMHYNTSQMKEFAITDAHAVHDFYKNFVQNASTSIAATGDLQWRPIAGIGAIWLLVFIAVLCGVRWLGKVCYFTVVIPVVLLFALMVRALTSDGSLDYIGSLFKDKTDWNKLCELETWKIAFHHSIQAVGLGLGSYITMGSYNKRNNNMVGDSWLFILLHLIITIAQFLVSAGFAGHLKHEVNDLWQADSLKIKTDNILEKLLYATSRMNLPSLWSAFLLFMVTFFILNTLYVLVLTAVSVMEDAFFNHLSHRWVPRIFMSFTVCCLGYALGIGYTVRAGPEAFDLVQKYLELLPYWVILACEIFAVAWFYCAHLLGRDIKQALANVVSWCCGYVYSYLLFILPAVPIYILVVAFMQYNPSQFTGESSQYTWVLAVGWIVALVPIVPIPLVMLYVIAKTCVHGPGFTCGQKLKYAVVSPMRYEVIKPSPPPRFKSTSSGAGYVLLPAAPLAEPEHYNDHYTDRVIKVSNI